MHDNDNKSNQQLTFSLSATGQAALTLLALLLGLGLGSGSFFHQKLAELLNPAKGPASLEEGQSSNHLSENALAEKQNYQEQCFGL